MKWDRAYQLIAGGVRGDVLAVLARGVEPMTGREIARRARASQQAARAVLEDLEHQGLVRVRIAPPAYLYELNGDHVAAPIVDELVGLRDRLLERIATEVSTWSPVPRNVTVFGSVARGDATADSDVDILVVRPNGTDPGFTYWQTDAPRLASAIPGWSGNAAQIIELTDDEVRDRARRRDRFLRSIRAEGLTVFGAPLDELTLTDRLDAPKDR